MQLGASRSCCHPGGDAVGIFEGSRERGALLEPDLGLGICSFFSFTCETRSPEQDPVYQSQVMDLHGAPRSLLCVLLTDFVVLHPVVLPHCPSTQSTSHWGNGCVPCRGTAWEVPCWPLQSWLRLMVGCVAPLSPFSTQLTRHSVLSWLPRMRLP